MDDDRVTAARVRCVERDGDVALVAYVVLDDAVEASSALSVWRSLQGVTRSRFGEYATPTGFVSVASLVDGWGDGLAWPEDEPYWLLGRAYEAPRPGFEATLAALWSEVLSVDRVSRHDSFFGLGGNSLSTVRLEFSIHKALGISVAVRELFEHAQLKSQARLLEAKEALGTVPAIEPIDAPRKALSFAQQRLWFLGRLGDSRQYNIQSTLQLDGPLSVPTLQSALDGLVSRHAVLRTRFVEEDGQAYQEVMPQATVAIEQDDVSDLTGTQASTRIESLVRGDAEGHFDFERGPMVRVRLIRRTADSHVLVLTTHHIAFDGWSLSLFTQELSALYTASLNDEASPLSPLSVQYADYAHWQREWLSGEVLAQHIGFWRDTLEDAPPVHGVPLDRPRQAGSDLSGVQYVHRLDDALSAQVQSLCEQKDVTLFMLLHTAYAVLLSRYSNSPDIVVGTPVAGRTRPEVAELIGFFVNTLVLRCRLEGDPSFASLLEQNTQGILDAFTHQEMPFEKLVDELQVQRSVSHKALYQIVFAVQNFEAGELSFPELSVSPYGDNPAISPDYELGLHVTPLGDGLEMSWSAQAALFDASTLQRLAHNFEHLLRAIVAAPTARLSQLEAVPPSQHEQLVSGFNQTEQPYPASSSLNALFEAHAAQTPTRCALVYGETSMDYQTLNAQANQLAHYLRAQGVGPDTLVGLSLPPSPETIIGMLGIAKAGGAYVPLDPELPEARLETLLSDTQVTWVLTTQAQMLEQDFEDVRLLPIDADMRQRLFSTLPTDNPEPWPLESDAPDRLAYVMYTSGSTGQPKGVMVSHRNVVGLVRSASNDDQYVEIDADDTIAHAASTAFDASTFEIWAALCNGAGLVHLDKETLLEPARLHAQLEASQVSVMFVTTALFTQVAQSRPDCFAGLKALLFGGEQVNYDAVDRVLAHSPSLALYHVYGPTETTTFATSARLHGAYTGTGRTLPIGGPMSNVRTYVLDPQHRTPVPLGGIGELYIGGRGVARGYWHNSDLTDAAFVNDPYSDDAQARLYKTGDLVRWLPDGTLEFIGRVDHQVKIRGFRIELGEIEHQLMSLATVQDALVVARRDEHSEHSSQTLVAYVVPTWDGEPDEAQRRGRMAEYRAGLLERLPEHMVPSAFVLLDALPLTTNGKVDRAALPAPEQALVEQAVYQAPDNELEALLCQLWEEALGRSPVGVNDNFFALGGDSILSIRVVSKIKEAGYAVSVKALFAHQTVAELAAHIEAEGAAVEPALDLAPFALLTETERLALGPAPEARYADAYPMSELQQGMVFHNMLDDDGSLYHNLFTFHVKMRWDEQSLLGALRRAFAQHPVLRTRFDLSGERPIQRVLKEVALPLHLEDLRGLDESQQQQAIDRWVQNELITSFDWEDSVFRVALFRRSEDSLEFGLSFHHAVYDGWSDSLFMSQLFADYQALMQGQTLPEFEPDTIFRDFIAYEQKALADPEAKAFWQDLLADAPKQQLPRQHAAADQAPGRDHATLTVRDMPALSDDLIALAARLQVPLQSVLLAVHCKVLSVLTGQPRVLTSMVTNGRPEYTGGDRALGLFLNSMPLSLSVDDGSWADLIQHVARTVTHCMQYRHYPLSAIVRESGQDFSEISFNYTHFHALRAIKENTNIDLLDSMSADQTNFDFTVDFTRDATDDEDLQLLITYDRSIYSSD
ncbi:MAG: amino acid adenylation domain-containing protein, partial [Pseudomonadota bacterium]